VKVLSISVTEAGRAHASRLPYERDHGTLADTVRARWATVDGFVLFVAVGAAVRIVAPLLADKRTDPAVVCVDESGRYAISVVGGHAGGANALAREVAGLLGAEAVVSTATDAVGMGALDAVPGFAATGDVAGVTAALLDGRLPVIEVDDEGWPLPPGLTAGSGPERIVVTDSSRPAGPGGPRAVRHDDALWP